MDRKRKHPHSEGRPGVEDGKRDKDQGELRKVYVL
jgi:hypothetical protein